MPLQSMHTNMPRLIEAHSGSACGKEDRGMNDPRSKHALPNAPRLLTLANPRPYALKPAVRCV